jgi:hypothetical protein
VATLYVHDAEASDSERHGALDILPLIIGASVHDRPEHFLQENRIVLQAPRSKPTRNTTHNVSLESVPEVSVLGNLNDRLLSYAA